MDDRSRHRQFEDHFLRQLRARAVALTGGPLKSDDVEIHAMPDGADALRAEMSRIGVYDRQALDQLPGSSSVEIVFRRMAAFGLLRPVRARLRTRVLTPVAELLEGRPGRPIGREEVLDALARYELMPKKHRPTGVVLASLTGFTEEARRLVESHTGATLVLVSGREDGGYEVTLPTRLKDTYWRKLFELESRDERLGRLRYHLEQDALTLDSRGVSAADLAARLGISAVETEALVRQACRNDPRLMTVTHDGRMHVCRTPLAMDEAMKSTWWSRIRRMLGFKPGVAETLRSLTAQRVQLEQQRHEVDRRVDALEEQERDVLHRGAEARTDAEKKQLAGKLIRSRRELKRLRSQAQLFSNQIDVIGTQIHHLTLSEQGRRVQLPSAEQLTAQAAQAESVMAELSANAELANQIEVTGETVGTSDEEAAIFAEFAQAAGKIETQEPESPETQRTPAAPSAERAAPGASPETPAPLRRDGEDKDKSRARPEIG